MMTSPSSESRLPPDLLQSSLGASVQSNSGHPPTFSFMPIGPASTSPSYSPPVRPVVNNAGNFKIKPFLNSQLSNPSPSSDYLKHSCTSNMPRADRRILAKRKTVLDGGNEPSLGFEPQRKVHLNEELVAQTMSNLYISHPRPKVARRNMSGDVAEAMNLNSLEELEEKFTHQAAITNSNLDEYSMPSPRGRKVPNRVKVPQLRLSIHQELKNMRTTNNILPESIMARYRPTSRTGSTAVVLWKPPSGCIPDLISSALRSGPGSSSYSNSLPTSSRPRIRCYSEVTSTPYSSHENLCGDSDMPDISSGPAQSCCLTSNALQHPTTHNCLTGSPTSAEAPELSYNGEIEVPPGVNLQRRNSAPEISEPLPFVDDGSMEL